MIRCGLELVDFTHIIQGYFTSTKVIAITAYCPSACEVALKNMGK